MAEQSAICYYIPIQDFLRTGVRPYLLQCRLSLSSGISLSLSLSLLIGRDEQFIDVAMNVK